MHPDLKHLSANISCIDCYAVRRRSLRSSEQVSGASQPRWPSVQNMGVDHSLQGGQNSKHTIPESFDRRQDFYATDR
jgi:hypothetical protein